jgi:hypothetical protein
VNKDKKPLSETHPELAKEAYNWDPTFVTYGFGILLEWKCVLGHLWKQTPNSRSSQKSGCPYCSNQKVLTGFNDLATTNPELAREAHGWDPKTIIAGTKNKLVWKCPKNHLWYCTGSDRIYKKVNCNVCSNRVVLAGFNDLATTNPELAREAHGWDPKTVIAGSHKSLIWQCKEGHIWQAKSYSRLKYGCPYCSNQKVLTGFNDLATTNPELAREAHGWDPKTVSAGSGSKLSWICSDGHIWKSIVKSRNLGSNCPSCSLSGFDPNKSGFVYFLIQPRWEIYQIGITNVPDERLKRHSKTGFELLELRGPIDGHTAQELETAILKYLKSQKADLSPEHVAGKFDGYSESWTIDSYKVNNLKELIDKASEAGF